ncbi:hypothetical protein CKAH01_08008, partial [Colletotrichum kahawae]
SRSRDDVSKKGGRGLRNERRESGVLVASAGTGAATGAATGGARINGIRTGAPQLPDTARSMRRVPIAKDSGAVWGFYSTEVRWNKMHRLRRLDSSTRHSTLDTRRGGGSGDGALPSTYGCRAVPPTYECATDVGTHPTLPYILPVPAQQE